MIIKMYELYWSGCSSIFDCTKQTTKQARVPSWPKIRVSIRSRCSCAVNSERCAQAHLQYEEERPAELCELGECANVIR